MLGRASWPACWPADWAAAAACTRHTGHGLPSYHCGQMCFIHFEPKSYDAAIDGQRWLFQPATHRLCQPARLTGCVNQRMQSAISTNECRRLFQPASSVGCFSQTRMRSESVETRRDPSKNHCYGWLCQPAHMAVSAGRTNRVESMD